MVKGIEALELAQLGFDQNWASIAQQGPHKLTKTPALKAS